MTEPDRPDEPEFRQAWPNRKWNNKVPRAILTGAPSAYLAIRIYLRTSDFAVAVGAGIICPFIVYYVFNAWLEDGSWLMRRSFGRWYASRSDERPLLAALAGAVIFIGSLTLMWFAVSLVTDYY